MAVDIAEVCHAAYEGQQERGLAVWLAILFCVYITLAVGLAAITILNESWAQWGGAIRTPYQVAGVQYKAVPATELASWSLRES